MGQLEQEMVELSECPRSDAEKTNLTEYLAYLSGIVRADERIRTADLISLRVITQALQGCAQGCKSRISKPVSFLRLAWCCTVLRSRWCQSGVNAILNLKRP